MTKDLKNLAILISTLLLMSHSQIVSADSDEDVCANYPDLCGESTASQPAARRAPQKKQSVAKAKGSAKTKAKTRSARKPASVLLPSYSSYMTMNANHSALTRRGSFQSAFQDPKPILLHDEEKKADAAPVDSSAGASSNKTGPGNQ